MVVWQQLVQHSQFKQGKMPSTSSCPVMVGRQWYRHTVRRTISAAQSVETGGEHKHSQFKQGKMPSTSSCPEMVVRQWYRHTMSAQLVQHSVQKWSSDSDTDIQWGEQLVQHSQFKQGKMPSTSSCPEMVGRQWYRHTVRRTISAAQTVRRTNRGRCQAQAHVQRWSADSDTDTQWGEQLVQHSQLKQGKMPSTSSCPEMVVWQWYRHTVRRTISAAQSVQTG